MELAVVLPFLVFLFVIAVDFGRILHFSQVLTDCARDGAIYSMFEPDPNDPDDQSRVFFGVAGVKSPFANYQEAALAEASGLSPTPTLQRRIDTETVDGHKYTYVEVTATWQFRTITHYPGVPDVTTLKRTVRMRWVDPSEMK